MARSLFGKLLGDRGYISQTLLEQLWEQGVQLVTRVRRNMKNRLLPLFDKLLLRKRSIIEAVNDQLKNISQIGHSRHRSPFNFFVDLIAGLAACIFREKKPSLDIRSSQALPVVLM
ncbi:transposase [Nitrosomonas sp. Nm166]|uniref:transposase n=1 Tax=Nitrosomonas sp. Nm166 TaxID=1881054 RepID=UPI0035245556